MKDLMNIIILAINAFVKAAAVGVCIAIAGTLILAAILVICSYVLIVSVLDSICHWVRFSEAAEANLEEVCEFLDKLSNQIMKLS